jgi:hypothetical protein
LYVDDSYLYWMTDTAIQRLPKAGGAPTPLVTASAKLNSYVIDRDVIYWTQADGQVVVWLTGPSDMTEAVPPPPSRVMVVATP